MPSTSPKRTNRLLGYPHDARLLIINADDFGMCHAINDGIIRSIHEGVVRSTSLMVPCPWALHAMELIRKNPNVTFGVHLTVICEAVNYRWKPLTSKERVSSLLDEAGNFYSFEGIPEFAARAKLGEVEIEFRAQINTVLSNGLKPTHLDWHCLANGGRDDIFDLTLGLAKEYGLAVRVHAPSFVHMLQSHGLPISDYQLLDSYRINTLDKAAHYAQLLRELPSGLSEWAVHPGIGNAELQALEVDSWQVRQTDFDFLISPQAKELIQQEGIILLNYRPIQVVWQGSTS